LEQDQAKEVKTIIEKAFLSICFMF